MLTRLLFAVALVLGAQAAGAQPVPQPFPKSGTQPPPRQPARPQTEDPQEPSAPPVLRVPTGRQAEAPTEATLGVPIYPGAQFITSYDAGQGQRYYLFGASATFADVVAHYRQALRERGDLVFEEPATHMFETGRFREESMAFPPSVTIKDYTWGNLGGYLNPAPDAQPERFPTVIQIVPAPAPVSRTPR
jgi:hypothetical protein